MARFAQITAVILVIGLLFLSYYQADANGFRTLLLQEVGWKSDDVDLIAAGEVRVRVGHEDNEELVLVGVAKCDVPPRFFHANYYDVLLSAGDEGQTGRVGQTPSAEDFATIRFPEDDVKDLKKARPGKCNVKITEHALQQLSEHVNWKNDEAASQCNAVMQEFLLQRTKQYMASGLRELAPYVDQEQPRSPNIGMAKILEYMPVIQRSVPAFHSYLIEYPDRELENAEDLLYWQVSSFGLKPTVHLKHAVTYVPPTGVFDSNLLIAEVGVYASHYFVASLGIVSVVTADLDGTGPAHYFMSVQRYRFDGKLGGLKRKMATGKLKKSFRATLEQQRDALTQAFVASN